MPTLKRCRVALTGVMFVLISLAVAGSGLAASARTHLAPAVTSFSPHSGKPGTKVTLVGEHFAGASATFGYSPAAVVSISSDQTHLVVTVPNDATSGANQINVTTTEGAVTAPGTFTVTIPAPVKPLVMAVAPIKAKKGATVSIRGKNFTGITAVTFGGGKVAYVVKSPTLISVRLTGTAKSGVVKITSRGGTASWRKFTVM